jgi:hypothetical protein
MNRILMCLFALGCLLASILMPWAELHLPETAGQANMMMPDFLRPLVEILKPLGALLRPVRELVVKQLPESSDPAIFSYYAYSLFLALALIAAALAINAIGREEAEEKTVLPVKK